MGHDVIVIGSGFGGAVCAANLAKAGMRVCILERGTWWGRSQGHRPLPESPISLGLSINSIHVLQKDLKLQLFKKGLIEVHFFTEAVVVNGIGVGGSSLLYAGISQRPPDDFFDMFPAEITKDEMEKYYTAIEDALRPSPCPVRTDTSGHLEKHAAKFGMKLNYASQAIQWGSGPNGDHIIENRFGVQQRNCNLCNNCTPGCNRGAKNSLDLNLIPASLNAGAELRDLCAADFIEDHNGEYAVHYHDLRSNRIERLNARCVVLAAGTVNTNKVLSRSRSEGAGRLSKLSAMLGKKISLGGDVMRSYRDCARQLPWSDRGHKVEAELEVFDERGRRDHFILPASSLYSNNWMMRVAHKRCGHGLKLIGFGRDDAAGEFVWNGKSLNFFAPKQPVVGRIRASMSRVAGTYRRLDDRVVAIQKDEIPQPRKVKASFHPMGGCRMGENTNTGVVDHAGMVYGHPGLYVADASIFAGPPVCAPSLTIAAFAWRVSDMIIDREGRR